MSDAARIDVHQHLIPPIYADAMDRHGFGKWAPHPWSLPAALAVMDTYEISTAVLSLTCPGAHFGDDAEARQLTREINDIQAELVKDHPGRFGMFATVPLPDVDGSLEAIRYAYDELDTDGVVLMANALGVYLGDPSFEPVMQELDRRSAVVFVHPTYLPGGPAEGLHPALVDFLLDTTRAAINLAARGVLRRYPNTKFILSHGGGFLPYAAHRIATVTNPGTVQDLPAPLTPAEVLDQLTSFYFDTAQTSSPTALPSLLAFARPGHVLYGTDSPYAPPPLVEYFTSRLDTYAESEPALLRSALRANAEAILPRVAAMSKSPA